MRTPWRTWKELEPVLDNRILMNRGTMTWTRRAALSLAIRNRWHLLIGGCPGCDRKRRGPHRWGCSIGGHRQMRFSVRRNH